MTRRYNEPDVSLRPGDEPGRRRFHSEATPRVTADRDDGWLLAPRFWRWAGSRTARVVVLWLVALGVGGQRLVHARWSFANRADDPPERQRADGNGGHALIDFGGQWVMGRMLVTGRGRELYNRNRQWEVVRAAFPPSAEMPLTREALGAGVVGPTLPTRPADDVRHDADLMMYWFMGDKLDAPEWRTVGGAVAAAVVPYGQLAGVAAAADLVTPAVADAVTRPAVGGPLYPPVQALVFAPLALDDDPQASYFAYQFVLLALLYFAALGVSRLSGGRVWWSAASVLLLLYPGARAGLDLGQNPAVSLAVVVWGWVLAARGREAAGGAVWGLLAFKPTWAAAFLLVPLLQRRWRFVAAMAAAGAAVCLVTVPFVGVQPWFDWLEVGKEASATYDVNRNWNFLSRDMQGIPRRLLIDFDLPEAERASPAARWIGWAAWGTVLATTVAVSLRWADRRRTVGVGPAFVYLGAYLSCYRFMYYDALLSAVGFAVLLVDVNRFRRATAFAPVPPPTDARPSWWGAVNSPPLTLLVVLGLIENSLGAADLRATLAVGRWGGTPKVAFATTTDYPWDTFILLAVWAWCGLRLVLGDEGRSQPPSSASSAAPMSGERMSDSPTSTA